MLECATPIKVDRDDWPGLLSAVAGLIPAQSVSLLGPIGGTGRLGLYAQSEADSGAADALIAALSSPRAAGEALLARILDDAPTDDDSHGSGDPASADGGYPRHCHVVVPLGLGRPGDGWLAASTRLDPGDPEWGRQIVDRLALAAPLVASRLKVEARLGSIRTQSLLDGLAESAPLSFLVSADGSVVAQSRHAARVFEAGGLVTRGVNGQLRLATPAATAELEGAIADVAARAGGEPEAQRVVRLGGDDDALRQWVAVVRPAGREAARKPGFLDGASPLHGASPRPACWVALRGPRLAGLPSIEALRQAFRFSESEAELVRHLMTGRSATSQATARGVTPDAANYHMKNIYQKTGCKRQPELVLLVQAMLGIPAVADIGAALAGGDDVAE